MPDAVFVCAKAGRAIIAKIPSDASAKIPFFFIDIVLIQINNPTTSPYYYAKSQRKVSVGKMINRLPRLIVVAVFL